MRRFFCLGLILILLLPRSAAAAGECPEGSEVVGQVAKADGGVQYQCKCVAGRGLIGGRCKGCELKDQENLMNQYTAAIEGMKSSLQALDFETWRIRYQYGEETQRNLPHTLLTGAMAVAVSPDPTKVTTAGIILLGEVSLFLTRMRNDLAKDPDAAVAVQNAENFKAIAEKKAEALKTCFTTALSLKTESTI